MSGEREVGVKLLIDSECGAACAFMLSEQVCVYEINTCIDSECWDRQTLANSLVPDQVLQNGGIYIKSPVACVGSDIIRDISQLLFHGILSES